MKTVGEDAIDVLKEVSMEERITGVYDLLLFCM